MFINKMAAILIGVGVSVSATGSFADNIFRLPAYSEETQAMVVNEALDGILVVSLSGCPTCRKQLSVLDELLAMDAYKDLKIQQIDLKNSIAQDKFNVRHQSTIIVYRDGEEVSRSTGLTAKDALMSELDKALL